MAVLLLTIVGNVVRLLHVMMMVHVVDMLWLVMLR